MFPTTDISTELEYRTLKLHQETEMVKEIAQITHARLEELISEISDTTEMDKSIDRLKRDTKIFNIFINRLDALYIFFDTARIKSTQTVSKSAKYAIGLSKKHRNTILKTLLIVAIAFVAGTFYRYSKQTPHDVVKF